ncbi:MAG: ABC transporter ATP-binding protein [Anaerolineaceae bacterium]|jgi:putative ABC transport system ATP-binding protein|nr:ABC transporter ATP-binding protein [Anaerolineaceae bacterium]HNX45936.1 ABC transporter ATP-binding protein [Anaerolineaceae bacterium]HPT23657.1 ABC transporter ATP-binding protein [Anaerolineaceae bacterium]
METTSTTEPVIRVRNMTKIYQIGDIEVPALRGVDLDVYPGEMVAIMGPSGSGKSTLMNMIGCLDSPSSGEYILDGQMVSELRDDDLAAVRNKKIGFVFQKYNLLPRANALENVELPLRYSNDISAMHERATAALQRVGLENRMTHKPNELSGGQQQRVAIARAIVNQPAIILADEPTGNLDTKSGQEILDLLKDLNLRLGTTVVIVTHDSHIAAQTQRTVRLLDGLVVDGEAMA